MTDIVKARERLAYIRDNPGVLMDLLCAPDDLGAERIAEDLRTLLSSEGEAVKALEALGSEKSPFDETGEPLPVRIAKDLTRRIELARSLHARACGRET